MASYQITKEHKISENLEAHIEEHFYSANNQKTDRYAITDYYVSVVFTAKIPLSW